VCGRGAEGSRHVAARRSPDRDWEVVRTGFIEI